VTSVSDVQGHHPCFGLVLNERWRAQSRSDSTDRRPMGKIPAPTVAANSAIASAMMLARPASARTVGQTGSGFPIIATSTTAIAEPNKLPARAPARVWVT